MIKIVSTSEMRHLDEFTINEVKQYREELYEFINKAIKSGMQLPKGNEKPYNNKSNNQCVKRFLFHLTFSHMALKREFQRTFLIP